MNLVIYRAMSVPLYCSGLYLVNLVKCLMELTHSTMPPCGHQQVYVAEKSLFSKATE